MDKQPAISSDLIRGHIDTIILHTLLDSDKFAQQISDAIELKSSNEYKINQATLYSSLKRLESLKYVESYWNDSDGGGRRKFFKITETGKSLVDDNLSSWSYSRSIIDKLMDCEPAPTTVKETIIVEKVVPMPIEKNEPQVQQEKVVENIIEDKQTVDIKKDVVTQLEIDTKQKSEETEKEINFRNILNGLIKETVVNSREEIELKPISEEKDDTKTDLEQKEKLNFNQTVDNIDYNSHRSNNGRIDFGDLAIKASKEGYKLRISSKSSYSPDGSLLINRLNLISACSIYLISIIEFLILSMLFEPANRPNFTVTIILIGILTLFPVFRLIQYISSPLKNTLKSVHKDVILTASIIVFNLVLIIFAGALLFNVDFTDKVAVLSYVAFPITISVDILIYFTLKYFISKMKICNKIQKKVAL